MKEYENDYKRNKGKYVRFYIFPQLRQSMQDTLRSVRHKKRQVVETCTRDKITTCCHTRKYSRVMLQAQLFLHELKVSPHTRERVLQQVPATFSLEYTFWFWPCNMSLLHFHMCVRSDFVPATCPWYIFLCVYVMVLSLGRVYATGPFVYRPPYSRMHSVASRLNELLWVRSEENKPEMPVQTQYGMS